MKKIIEINQSLQQKHENEIKSETENFNKNFPNQPKFSSEVLNCQKQMEEHIKSKEYEKANELKIKIINLCSEQETKWKTEIYEKKLNAYLEKFRIKNSNEMSKAEVKNRSILDRFMSRCLEELRVIENKFKNKFRDMLNDHVISKNSFQKPSKASLIKKIENTTFN